MTTKRKQPEPPKMTHTPRTGGTVTKPEPTQPKPTQPEATDNETDKA